MADTILDQIKARVQKATGKSTYGIGFSGADSVMSRVQNTVKTVTAKGAMGTVQSIVKGEKPILSNLAPGSIKPTTGTSGAGPILQRIQPYRTESQDVTQQLVRSGTTKIGSRGN